MNTKPSIKEFFYGLSNDAMQWVDVFYDENIEFIDPLVRVQGKEAMRNYYKGLYVNVRSIKFDFSDEVVDGDTHVAAWKMTLVSKLKNGKPTTLDGLSHIKFGGPENKAVYHRDYYDMGQFVYEDLPLLGTAIRYVKKRLTEHV